MEEINLRRGRNKLVAMTAVAILAISGVKTYAATEQWNDASLSADSSAWTKWKTNWGIVADDYEKLSMTPGTDETKLNFAWYSHTKEIPKVRYAPSQSSLAASKVFEGSQESTTVAYSTKLKESLGGKDGTYYSNKVVIYGLKANTTYYYQIYQNGTWSSVKEYETDDFTSYSVLYFADPQIGACKNQTSSENELLSGITAARNDTYNWNDIITDASNHHDVSFMISAGDQVNTAANEYEYAGFLYPSAMESTPLASTIGNHDSSSYAYSWHFNNPNSFDIKNATQTSYTNGHTNAGTDYYYTYGEVLYIVLDTNNQNCTTHENVIAKAVKENSDCKWRIVTFHQDIYGSGADHSDSDGMVLRTQLTPIMDEYDIDVVLQGHDHTYSRSYQITSDGQKHTAYNKSNYKSDADYLNQNLCYKLITTDKTGNQVANPEGTVYFEENSATGSKYYNLTSTKQDYIAERSQTWAPSYSVIEVTDDTLTIKTYDATTNAILKGSTPYTIVKSDATEKQSVDLSKVGKIQAIEQQNYTGEKIKPKCTVKVGDKVLKKGTDYTVTYSSNKNIGTAKVTVKGINNYTGKLTRTFKIVLKKPSLKADVEGKKVTLKWKKITGASGYTVYRANKKNGKYSKIKTITKARTLKYADKKVTKGKNYYYKIKAYRMVKGKKVYSSYSTFLKIQVK